MKDRLPTRQMEFGRWLMACQFDVFLNAGLPLQGGDAAVEALNQIEWLEGRLSVYRAESELSYINRAAFEATRRISNDLANLLKVAFEVYQRTSGAFDMTSATLTELWGFAQRQGRMPTPEQIRETLQNVGMQHVEFDAEAQSIRFLSPDVRLNPGGIGKGYALDQAVSILRNRGVTDFLIHGGKSSLVASGNRYDLDCSEGWRIAVNHPEQPRIQLGELTLKDVALGTSGPANQFFYYQGRRYGHIIDPRSGWPASGMLSITVLHPSAAFADALATGLFVLGSEAAIEYCRNFPETSLLAILPTSRAGQVEVITSNLGQQVWKPSR
jgi:FAD:protein FMN transferase